MKTAITLGLAILLAGCAGNDHKQDFQPYPKQDFQPYPQENSQNEQSKQR